MILDAGYYSEIAMADYLADPCKEPSLSTSTAATLFERSARHAKQEHPRLGGKLGDTSPRADIGSAVHAKVLGGYEVVYADPEFKDWRKDAVKTFRDQAREMNKIPLLASDRHQVEMAAGAASMALALLGEAKTEQTMIFQHNGVWCRSRADWLGPQDDVDLKTCADADETTWIRQCVEANNLDIQMGLRSLGHVALGQPRRMAWLLVEIEPPYATNLIYLGNSLLHLAGVKIDYAAKVWRQCLDTQTWPGYSSEAKTAEAAPFAETRIMERLRARGMA